MKKYKLFKRDFINENSYCHYCGSVEDLTVDHKKALSMGGVDEFSNMIIACRWCNSTKSNADYNTFILFLSYLEEKGINIQKDKKLVGRKLGDQIRRFNKKNSLLLHPPILYATR